MSDTCALQRTHWIFPDIVKKYIRLLFSDMGLKMDGEAIACDEAIGQSQMSEQTERLLKEYGNSILRLAYSYLHNRSDAEDVLQDVLIQFIKTTPKFESAEHEKAWLMRVSINISKNKISYNKIRKADELHENLAAEEKEDLLMVWDAVRSLPAKYSEVIHLYYHQGYPTAKIAELLSKNESTVRSLLKRAKSKLKAVLMEVYDFEE
jgi:RNA polymerase sigma factor (sigma-70 family)